MKTLREQAIAHQKEAALHAKQAMWLHVGDYANKRFHLDTARHHQWMARHHAECAWRCLLALLLREPII